MSLSFHISPTTMSTAKIGKGFVLQTWSVTVMDVSSRTVQVPTAST
jgi:hypothetical protein